MHDSFMQYLPGRIVVRSGAHGESRFPRGEAMKEYFLLRKDGGIEFEVPDSWTVIQNAVLEAGAKAPPVYDLVDAALKNPIGTAPLHELIHPSSRLAILVDDCTRPTPRKEMLSCLFDRLREYGLSPDRADIVFALGTHRPMTKEEVRDSLGSLEAKVRWWNHDAWSPNLVSVGRLPSAGEIKIDPVVAAADFRISVGSILPHPMNGFGGGAKNIFPGVGNFAAIRDHHNNLMLNEGAAFGNTLTNPFNRELCEAARLARLDFIVNAVYDASERVQTVVAGDFVQAYEHGAAISRRNYGVDLHEKADVTIVSAFPYEEAPQLIKPLCAAAESTRDGGFVILYVERIGGGRFPEGFLKAFDSAYLSGYKDMKELVRTSMREGRLVAPEAAMDFNSALNLALIHLNRVKAILVCGDADESTAGRLGFLYAGSLSSAVEMVEKKLRVATVNILPSGGLIVPRR